MSKSFEELAAEIACAWIEAAGATASGSQDAFLKHMTPEAVGEFYKKVHHAIWEAYKAPRPQSPQVGHA